MLGAWRRVTLVALTAGAAIAAQLAGVAPAQAAGPAITIAAASKIGPVTGYVVVAYRQGKYASARVHGTITGATAGEVVTLYAQSFPYAKASAPVRSATLRAGGTTAYSFTVTPTLATRYKVKLFARKTAASPLATSPVKNVYVTVGGAGRFLIFHYILFANRDRDQARASAPPPEEPPWRNKKPPGEPGATG